MKKKKITATQVNTNVVPAKHATNEVSAGEKMPRWIMPTILTLTGLLYSRALQNGLTSYDDDYYIEKNPFLKDFSWNGIKAIFTSFHAANYHPLTTLSYFFEYNLFGTDPLPYHLINVIIHLVNTWLVYTLASKLSGRWLTGIIVSILFAIHPLHVESVAWVSERKDVLYAMYYLLSLIVYLRYIENDRQKQYYVLALGLFLLSLFSKAAAVTLPILLIVIDIYKHRRINAKSLAEKIPFLFLSLVFGIVNLKAQGQAITDIVSTYNPVNRAFLITSTLSFYFIKLIAPFHLSALHFYPGLDHGKLPWIYYLSLPFLTAVAILTGLNGRNKREKLFGIAFFIVTLIVMMQIISVGSALASERYTYIPYIGLFYIAAQWTATTGLKKYRNVCIAVSGIIIVIFCAQTWIRIGIWKNDDTLFGDIRDKDSSHAASMAVGFAIRGDNRKAKGELNLSLEDYTQAVLFNPKFGDAYFDRALTYFVLGNMDSAIADYTRAIGLKTPSALLYGCRGWAYYQTGKNDLAIADYNKALSIDSAYAPAYNNRGWALYNMGRKSEGMDDFNRAIQADPKLSGAYNNRGWAYYQQGDIQAALADYDKATALDSNNNVAYSNIAAIKGNTGDLKGALDAYSSMIRINRQDKDAYYGRSFVFLHLKDTTSACNDLRQAAHLGHQYAPQMIPRYCH